MAAYASKLNPFFSFGGHGSDSTYWGVLTITAPRPAALAYGEPVTAARASGCGCGGNLHDVLGAHAGGIICVGIARHYVTTNQLRGAGADHVMTSLTRGLPPEGMEVTA